MWGFSSHGPQSDYDAGQSVRDLLEETTRTLIWIVGGLWGVWQVVATAVWPGIFDWYTWPITLLLIVTSALSLRLLTVRLHLAQAFWMMSVLILITLALYLFQQSDIAFAYAILPLLAVVLFNEWMGALFVLTAAGAMWCMSLLSPGLLAPSQAAGVVAACIVTALIGWATARTLFTMTHWSLTSFAQARKHMEEAQHHRAQMAQLYKNLDLAYYRLERTNAGLVAARKTAEEAEQFKTEFVTNVSHELRTPLNLIVGFTEMIMTAPESYGEELPAAYRGDLHSIYYSAQHLLKLVDDVLDLARIEVGRFALVRDQTNLSVLVAEAESIVGDYMAAKGLHLHTHIEPELPVLYIDYLRIRQVLLNLLVNAARHTEHGGVEIQIGQQASSVLVRVVDTGCGIPEREQRKVFEEFRSLQHAFSPWQSGSGLGLPISKKFVEMHGGQMGVESAPNQGSCFWFTLPLVTGEHAHGGDSPRKRHRPLVDARDTQPIAVVVHNEPQIATLLQRYMDRYQIVRASTLCEGAELAQRLHAIALVVDAAEPAPSDLADSLPSDLLTVRCALPSSSLTSPSLPADALLVKPVSRRALLAAIERLPHSVNSVLIADDNPDVVRLFQRMLRGHIAPAHCRVAYNGVEAMEQLNVHKPDLVLLDLIMPEVDGHSVLARMAADPQLADVAVIVVSAHGQAHTDLRLAGPLHISRAGGFEFGELARTLHTLLSELTPGWRASVATDQEHAADLSVPRASRDSPPRPKSLRAEAH